MKPQVIEDEEDDLQAEEENKLINEVRGRAYYYPRTASYCILHVGIQNMVRVCALSRENNPQLGRPNRKKNAPYLYDVVITHALDWPSLTCQWFPDKESYVSSPSPV